MSALLPQTPLLATFLLASLILAVTPGPGVLYIVARSVAHGWRAGLASVGGVAAGNLGNALGAALGLAALFRVSSMAFDLVRYFGAVYLVWIGIRNFREVSREGAAPPASPVPRIFRDGLIVALFNPKTALFFAAFLPQFVAGPDAAAQTVVLSVLFVLIAATTDSIYALTAAKTSKQLRRADQLRDTGRRLGASVLVGLGMFALLTGSRQSH